VTSSIIEELMGGISDLGREKKRSDTDERIVFPDPAVKQGLSSSSEDKESAYVYRGPIRENQFPFSILGKCPRG